MLDIAFKNLAEHKLRTFLTVLGIAIAITAIVALGSISAGMKEIVHSSLKQMGSDTIIVMKHIDITYGPPQIREIDEDIANEIAGMDGVELAVPVVRTNYLGIVPILGINFEDAALFNIEDVDFKDGGWYDDEEYGCVIGKNVAEERKLGVGDEIEINGKKLDIVGVFEAGEIKGMNYIIAMPYTVAQDVLDMKGKATMIIVKPTDIKYTSSIKHQIEEEYDDMQALTTQDMLKMASEITSTVSIVTLGIGFVASIVAAIGIIITMLNSVHERKRQIGIMKAIGANRLWIIIEVLEESLIVSIIAGIAGLVAGSVMVSFVNKYVLAGFNIASVTPELAAFAFIYSISLALVFSLYPAWRASTIDPIEAIRD
ncbi:MAG TPA: ABC transporter permease [Candidatus Aenigmarchaeota archaeon]|nr:MAG: hypothetical protein DRP03_02135 [Candidatus Aenigmarchaeota archaeon]HDD46492.1 ABC transporter permease [Candidatus Aenigmarchaeota archaeon]